MLGNVLRVISDISDWFPLGTWLGLRVHTLDTIKKTYMGCPESCKAAMVEKWLQGRDDVRVFGGPSWQQLAGVLRDLGHAREAQRVEEDACLTHDLILL